MNRLARRAAPRRLACFFALVLAASLAPTATFAQQRDPTLEATEKMFLQGFSSSRDATLVLSALRSSRDPALAPLFDRLATMKDPDMQIYGMVSAAILTKDPAKLDVGRLLKHPDANLVGSAIASLIETETISNEQLQKILTESRGGAQRAMVADELAHRKALADMGVLKSLATDANDGAQHYAAVSLLLDKDQAQLGLQTLLDLQAKHNPRNGPIQGIMLVRVRKEKIVAAAPWAEAIARDRQVDEGLRYTAVATLLGLQRGDGPAILAELIGESKEIIQQLKLALIAVEFAGQIKPAVVAPLEASKSKDVRQIAAIARAATEGKDVSSQLVKLMSIGHPIILDWSLLYADRTDADRALILRTALVEQAAIVDERRDRDYERAAIAAQKLLEENKEAGRKAITRLLHSDNRAVVEATLAGMFRSTQKDLSEMILPIWESLGRKEATEGAANYAALILAREGHKEPLGWLVGMVQGGRVQNTGFRVLAGWQYAKLKGETDTMLKRVLAAVKDEP